MCRWGEDPFRVALPSTCYSFPTSHSHLSSSYLSTFILKSTLRAKSSLVIQPHHNAVVERLTARSKNIRQIHSFLTNMNENYSDVQFITVNNTTCIKSVELKTWQHVSATTSHHQAKDRTNSLYIQWLYTLWDPISFTCLIIIIIIIIIIGIQPLGRSGQRPEFSQATGMALVRCILCKFLGVACHCFPPLFRCSHFSPPGASTSATTWEILAAEVGTVGENVVR
jgi:hypothetical protein